MIAPNNKARFLYLAQIITYGSNHPIKVGVSKNVPERIKQLRGMDISCHRLLGVFEFSTAQEAFDAEQATCRAFPLCPRYGDKSEEILAASFDELTKFISLRNPLAFEKAE